MKLMQNEKIIKQSPSKELVLTTHRIRYNTTSFGKEELTSIMLEELCSCSFRYKSRIILLVVGLLLNAAGVYAWFEEGESYDPIPWLIGSGLILVVAYFVTKKKVLAFRSAGDSIILSVEGLNVENAIDFINAVETAKKDRTSDVSTE